MNFELGGLNCHLCNFPGKCLKYANRSANKLKCVRCEVVATQRLDRLDDWLTFR